MNTPINFQLAKLLKEKGFNINEKYQNYFIENAYYNEDGELIDCEEQSGSLVLFEGQYAAPTTAEVVMWCFNKYKYSIEYSMNIPESGEYNGCYVFNGLIKGSEDYKLKIFYTSKDYPTVEKALEDTINYFLVNFC